MSEASRTEDVKTTPPWVRRTLLAVFCLGLLVAVGAVFTQVIAARVPQQRATLERLITDRTGFAVRFDNVHFAWGMDGASAVFEHVELTDPVRDRVRVVAPELRVKFDAWDFLRHQQFTLGQVTLSSPDIDIVGEAEILPDAPPRKPVRTAKQAAHFEDEAALLRRYTAWAGLMPIGRVEVEGARVHLFRRGERAPRHSFTLSQAVVSRGAQSFNAFGTLLLSQDIGQSLFVSAALEGMSADGTASSGDLRVIARRVFLDKLPALSGLSLAARGRGTLDAKLSLREGRIHDGSWQFSVRELQMPGERRFDHLTLHGRLDRGAEGFDLQFTDMQITRGAHLERAPKISAQVALAPQTLHATGISLQAERLPFMAAQLIAGAVDSPKSPPEGSPSDAPRQQLAAVLADAGWTATAGQFHDLAFDSRAGTFSAHLSGARIERAEDGAQLSSLAGRIERAGEQLSLVFDGETEAALRMGEAEPRALRLAGAVKLRDGGRFDLAELQLRSDAASIGAEGSWAAGQAENRTASPPLTLKFAEVDRGLLADVWSLLAFKPPAHLADLQEGRIVGGQMSLVPARDPAAGRIDWQRSRGSLQLAALATAGADVPRLADGAGTLEFSRGASQLRLGSGNIEELQITEARIDWPRRGPPRLRAAARGSLDSPLLRRALEEQGLAKLAGAVSLEAEARGEDELRQPDTWRVTARIREASLPLASGYPPVEALQGTVRLDAGTLRNLALTGNWLGGPLEIASRRTGVRGVTTANVNGVADTAQLFELLGQPEVAGEITGQLAWSGVLQKQAGAGDSAEGWQLSLASNLSGVESRLPAPFGKTRARAVPITAELRFDAQGLREFDIASGRNSVQGSVQQDTTLAKFNLQGISGELRDAAGAPAPRLSLEKLDLRRAPLVLAAAGALLPPDQELDIRVAELRHNDRDLLALEASLLRRAGGIEFSLESADSSPHRLEATGSCAASQPCQMKFRVQTQELANLLADAHVPAEWPTRSLRASGELAWPREGANLLQAMTGNFDLETQGADSSHQLVANAVIADGRIDLTDVQGAGPQPDLVFRGSGRVALAARTYDVTVDYEQMALAGSAVPTPARMRLSRAWSTLRGSVAGEGWPESETARRVQWHGSWD